MICLEMNTAQEKVESLEGTLQYCLALNNSVKVDFRPARDLEILKPKDLPDKLPLSTAAGQARLMHDLGSIELQAMELGVRTLLEFPDAPREFREELAEITRGEKRHFEMCLRVLEDLGHPWRSFPTHMALWNSTSCEDSLLDRILIVHRYLEGSGLDASEGILRKLNGTESRLSKPVVETILREEVDHVAFGSKWYHQICKDQKIDSTHDFGSRMNKLRVQLPKRMERISKPLRLNAGFTESEIEFLESWRDQYFKR
ncbi:MAG: DUF455 family protein [Pseudobdellovibrionaceae bacterium]